MMLRLARLCMTGLAAAAIILGGQTAASARTGTVQIQLSRAGLVVGVSEGGGILTFRGRHYRLAVSGASFGATVGISRADLLGYVYNLRGQQVGFMFSLDLSGMRILLAR